jgi:hypothetical protein
LGNGPEVQAVGLDHLLQREVLVVEVLYSMVLVAVGRLGLQEQPL